MQETKNTNSDKSEEIGEWKQFLMILTVGVVLMVGTSVVVSGYFAYLDWAKEHFGGGFAVVSGMTICLILTTVAAYLRDRKCRGLPWFGQRSTEIRP